MQDNQADPFYIFKQDTAMTTEDLDFQEIVKSKFLELSGVTEDMDEATASQLPGAMQRVNAAHTQKRNVSKRRMETVTELTGIPQSRDAQFSRMRPRTHTERPRESPPKAARPAVHEEGTDDRRWARGASSNDQWTDWAPPQRRHDVWGWDDWYGSQPWRGWRDWSSWTQWSGWQDRNWRRAAKAAAATAAASTMPGADASPSGESATAGVPDGGDQGWFWIFCTLMMIIFAASIAARFHIQRYTLKFRTVASQTDEYDAESGVIYWTESGRDDLRYHTDPACRGLRTTRSRVGAHHGCALCTGACTVRKR